MGNYSNKDDVKNCFDEFKSDKDNTRLVRLTQTSIIKLDAHDIDMSKKINEELATLISSNYSDGFKFIDLKINAGERVVYATIIYEIDAQMEITKGKRGSGLR